MKLYPLPSRDEKDAIDTAHRMRAALAGDNEVEMTKQVKQLNTELNRSQELFISAWSYLNSDERRTWKALCKVKS